MNKAYGTVVSGEPESSGVCGGCYCGDWDVVGPEANYLFWASSNPRMNHPEATCVGKSCD